MSPVYSAAIIENMRTAHDLKLTLTIFSLPEHLLILDNWKQILTS